MLSSRTASLLVSGSAAVLAAVLTGAPAFAKASLTTCPAPVKATVEKAYPGDKILGCKEEKDEGVTLFEVKLERKGGGKVEIDVSPDGKILQTEEVVGLDTLPEAVTKAFAARYPGAKATRAEKQQKADGKVSYEIAWKTDKGKKEATFAADGTFVEEE